MTTSQEMTDSATALQLLDDVSAALGNCILHHGKSMEPADREARSALVRKAREFCDLRLRGAEVPETSLANVAKYDAELNRLEIAPNGDDYNAIMSLINGGDYVAPHEGGR